MLDKNLIKPKKWLGQNFLQDKNILGKIIQTADIQVGDIILEIGPGRGVLTFELAKKAKQVIAIEKDKQLAEMLEKELKIKKINNVKIIVGDVLKIKNLKLPAQGGSASGGKYYKLVANLPYYITSPIIRMFLENGNPPQSMVLMVQKEVGQRICAVPPNMNLLAVAVQFYAEPKIISYVSKNCFWPKPKVDSAIIKISNIKNHPEKVSASFFKIVKAGFSQPRKQLIGNLAKGLKKDKTEIEKWLLNNNLNPKQRAETLSLSGWNNLSNSF